MSHEEVVELLPILALDAVPRGERDLIESHLEECSSCRDELAGYYEAVSSLVVPVRASNDLWQRVAAAIGV